MIGVVAAAIIATCAVICAATRRPAVIGVCLIIAVVMIMFL